MARRIGVIEPGGTTAVDFVKKSVVLLMIQRKLWLWEREGEIARKLSAREIALGMQKPFQAPTIARSQAPLAAEDSLMPPIEISGCKFKPPANFRQNTPHFIANYCTPNERVTYA